MKLMTFEHGDVVREKGNADAPEMTVVLEVEEKSGRLTCNWDDKNGHRQIWEGTPDQLELVKRGRSG